MDWQGSDEPYCAGYVNKSVGSVQQRQGILMALHEPVLHAVLLDWEKKTRPAELLKLKDREAVRLSNFYNGFCEYHLGKDLC